MNNGGQRPSYMVIFALCGVLSTIDNASSFSIVGVGASTLTCNAGSNSRMCMPLSKKTTCYRNGDMHRGKQIHSLLVAQAISSSSSTDEDLDDYANSSKSLDAVNNVRGGASSSAVVSSDDVPAKVGVWPCFDELDRKIIKLAIPSIANFAINPLVGAVDLFWVGRMGNALALAGMSAANQVFNSAFWLFSFLPTITAPLVSKAHARGDKEQVQDLISQAIILGVIVSATMSVLMHQFPEKFLSTVLGAGAPAMESARAYLKVRAISFFPAMVATVGFAAFRGECSNV